MGADEDRIPFGKLVELVVSHDFEALGAKPGELFFIVHYGGDHKLRPSCDRNRSADEMARITPAQKPERSSVSTFIIGCRTFPG